MLVKLRRLSFIRAVAIVLLFAMFHYIAGYRLCYSLGILYTKNVAKKCMLYKSNIEKLTFSASDYNSLRWTEKGHEFSFNKKMYDVASTQKIKGAYIINAYPDTPETKLVTAFHQFENELFHPDNANKSSKSAEDIMSSFQKEYVFISDFRIHLFASTRLYLTGKDVPQYCVQIPDSIWHPPLGC